MPASFNHTIIAAKDRRESARFLRELDRAHQRLRDAGVEHWADPQMTMPGQINHEHGGRGVYFLDPAGHGIELSTRPYL